MDKSIPLLGQWLGYFEYGPEYGEELAGERVAFRLFVDAVKNYKFEGKIADLDGAGSAYEVLPVNGFVRDEFISFTKEYPHRSDLDEYGNFVTDEESPVHVVNYQGAYDPSTGIVSGDWDITTDLEVTALKREQYISSGTWAMKKDD